MDIAFKAVLTTCLLGLAKGQLFPFSTLHQRVLKESAATELSPAASSVQSVRIETNERPSRQAASDPRTVVVTPRPKYRPHNFVQEPSVGPDHSAVPSMMDDKSMRERMKPTRETPRTRLKTVVDSVPSLSVVIPAELTRPKAPSPPLFAPPSYATVYRNKPVLADFDTTPLRESGKSETRQYKEWHRKPDKKWPPASAKRKNRGGKTPAGLGGDDDLVFESQIEWGPPSSSVDTFTHRTPTYHLDPYYEHYIEHIARQPSDLHYTTVNHFDTQHPPALRGPSLGSGMKSQSDESTRINYQLKDHRGPQTYKFGYDTGTGDERTFRFEEKDEEGSIRGQYGFYDETGKLNMVQYMADEHGFRALPS